MNFHERFSRDAFEAVDQIWETLKPKTSEDHSSLRALVLSMDLEALQENGQALVDALMLCSDVETAIEALRKDRVKLAVFVALTMNSSPEQRALASVRAADDLQSEAVILPISGMCSFLVELLRILEA